MSHMNQLAAPQFAFNHLPSAVVFMLKCNCGWKQQKRSWTPTYAQKEKNGQESVIICINQPKMSNKICLYLFYDSLVFAKSASLSGCYVQANQSLVLLVVKDSPVEGKTIYYHTFSSFVSHLEGTYHPCYIHWQNRESNRMFVCIIVGSSIKLNWIESYMLGHANVANGSVQIYVNCGTSFYNQLPIAVVVFMFKCKS